MDIRLGVTDPATHTSNQNEETPGAFRAWLASESGRTTTKVARAVVSSLVVAFLAVQLYRIGWRSVLAELPRDIRFYLILVLLYVNLPLVEGLIYRMTLKLPYARLVPSLFKKRVLNRDLIEYAGEVSFYSWAARESTLSRKQVFHVVKDNVIASAGASILYAVTFLAGAVAFGALPVPESFSSSAPKVAAAIGVAVTIAAIIYRYRHAVFTLSGRMLLGISGIHYARLALVSALQILQWAIVLPSVPLAQLVTIHALQVVTHRIPFLPSRELIFVGASIELARVMEMSMAEMAGVLVAAAAIEKVINLILYGGITAMEGRRREE